MQQFRDEAYERTSFRRAAVELKYTPFRLSDKLESL